MDMTDPRILPDAFITVDIARFDTLTAISRWEKRTIARELPDADTAAETPRQPFCHFSAGSFIWYTGLPACSAPHHRRKAAAFACSCVMAQ